MIDFSKTYKVEPKVRKGDSNGLDRYNLPMYPGTTRSIGVSFDERTKKYLTGLDIYHPSVQNLPKEQRDSEIEWIEATKKDIETQIGQPGCLDPNNSDFWDVWRVELSIGEDKNLKFNGSHPMLQPNNNWEHKLALITLKASGLIPMSKKESLAPEYISSKFVITSTEEEATFTKEVVRKNRQTAIELANLFDETNSQYDRAWNIAYLMGVVREKVGIERLEEILEGLTKDKEYQDQFLKLCKTENDLIQTQVMVKKAIYFDIIKYNGADKIYYRGGANFRSTEEATVKYLLLPEQARELMEITEAVRKREKSAKKAS